VTALWSALWPAIAAALDWRLAVAALATAVAGVMRGFAGFGTAITLAPVYSVLWGPSVGVPTMLLLEAAIGSQLLFGAWKDVNRRVAFPMAGAACAMLPFGAWLLLVADPAWLTRAMGALVIVFGGVLASGWRYRGSRPAPLTMAVGAVAGLMKGSTGMSGPPVILYLLAGSEEAREHRANLILFFAILGIVALLPPFLMGLFTAAVLIKVALLVPLMLLFVRVGAAMFGRVGQASFRAVAYGILFVVGLIALLA
jgi:uncharacterized membrane protein YfcA